jgi:hypothetical protein
LLIGRFLRLLMGDAGQVKYHFDTCKQGHIGFVHGQVQCPGRDTACQMGTRPAQRNNRVTLVSQLLAKSASDESGCAGNEASHAIQGLLTLFESVAAMKKGAKAPS